MRMITLLSLAPLLSACGDEPVETQRDHFTPNQKTDRDADGTPNTPA